MKAEGRINPGSGFLCIDATQRIAYHFSVPLYITVYHFSVSLYHCISLEFILYEYNNTTVHITVSPYDCISLHSAYHSITAKCISLGTTALLSIQ